MTREEKVKKRKTRGLYRVLKNKERNHNRWYKNGMKTGRDCPYDVDMNGIYGTCDCDGEKYNDCLGDI